MKINYMILGLCALLFLSPNAWALSADEIVEKANLVSYYAGQDGSSQVAMTITDSRGRQRNREFAILRMNVERGGKQKFYVYFHQPADVARMVYMVWKHIGQDDDRWLYLPALDLVRRIAASDKRSSFVGSHFVYEDVSGRSPEADTHELVEETDTSYQLKNIPKDKKNVEFAYYFVWVDKDNFMPMKAEYYNDQDELIRTIEALEVKEIEGYPTVVKSKVTDQLREGHTVMEFSQIDYDVGLEDKLFQERYLRRPPAKWIR